MAAINFESINVFPHVKAFSVTTNAQELIVPATAQYVIIGNTSASDKIYYGQNGQTDAAAFDTALGFDVPAANAVPVDLPTGSTRATSIFVASHTGTITVQVAFNRRS